MYFKKIKQINETFRGKKKVQKGIELILLLAYRVKSVPIDHFINFSHFFNGKIQFYHPAYWAIVQWFEAYQKIN